MPTRLSPPRLAPPSHTDRDLLRAYAEGGDPAAFAELARRHAGLAHRAAAEVCPAAADDAAQAALILLGRKAATVAARASAAGWVFETARRLALKARTAAARRARHEARVAPPPTPADPLDALTLRELRAAVAEEVARLPDELRAPLVLCYWDGQPREAAAARVGCSVSTLKRRLDEGRDRLAARLARRGFTGPAVLAALAAVEAGGRAAVPPAVLAAATGAGPLTAGAAALLRSARWGAAGKLAAVVAAGAGLAVGFAPGGRPDPPAPPPKLAAEAKADGPPADAFGDPLPPDALARMGSIRWRHHEELGNQLHVVPSPTGRHVATAAVGVGVIRVFDLSDGRRLCEFPWEKGAGYEVRFTPDGSRVFYLAERGVVRFFDPATGKPTGETGPVLEEDVLRRVRGEPDVWNERWTTHQLTKDGRWVVTAHPADGGFTLTLTEVAASPAKPRQVRLDVPAGFRKGVEVYEYAVAGDTLIGAGRESAQGRRGPVVFRWDLRSGTIAKTTRIEVRESGFDLSRDGKRLVTYRTPARVWDTETGAEAVRLEAPTETGYGTRFSADGRHLVGIVPDPGDEATATATLWELDGGKVVGRVKVPRRYDNPFLLADGRTLLAATRGLMLSTWDVPTGRRLGVAAGHEDRVSHLAFSADGTTLYTGSADRGERITAWDAGTGKRLRELAAPGGYFRFVPTAGGTVVAATPDGTLVWADAKTGREVRRVEPGPLAADLGGSAYADLSPCLDPTSGRPAVFGLLTAARSQRKFIARWDAGTGELLAHRAFPTGRFDRFAAVSPDGRLVARETCDLPADGKGGPKGDGVGVAEMLGRQAVVLEDALTGAALLRLNQPDYLQSGSVAFTPDGQALVTWTSTYPAGGKLPGVTTVRVWELRSGKQRLAFALPVIGKWWEFEPQTTALSADGRLLAAARPDKAIRVWDLATGAEVARRSGHGTVVGCLAFRPDGKALASGHADGTAVVWDLSGVTPARPAAADRDAAWADLASDDAGTAYRTVLALAADPECAAFLQGRVKPVEPAPADRVRRLVADLDSPAFATRERATAGLSELGDTADDQLRAALKGDLSAEQRRRVEDVLGRRGLTESDPGRLRALRCVEALERAGSADARAALAELAKGAAGARLTRDATGALGRLAGR